MSGDSINVNPAVAAEAFGQITRSIAVFNDGGADQAAATKVLLSDNSTKTVAGIGEFNHAHAQLAQQFVQAVTMVRQKGGQQVDEHVNIDGSGAATISAI